MRRRARAATCCLLNTDTELFAGRAGAALDRFLEGDRRLRCRRRHASCIPTARTQRTCQAFPGLWTPLFFATPLERWFPRSPRAAALLPHGLGPRGRPRRRSAPGGLPPGPAARCSSASASSTRSLWLFFNDVDLSRRHGRGGLEDALPGRRARRAPRRRLHVEQFGDFVPEYQRNRLTYYRKHHGRLAGAWVKCLRHVGLPRLRGAAPLEPACGAGAQESVRAHHAHLRRGDALLRGGGSPGTLRTMPGRRRRELASSPPPRLR